MPQSTRNLNESLSSKKLEPVVAPTPPQNVILSLDMSFVLFSFFNFTNITNEGNVGDETSDHIRQHIRCRISQPIATRSKSHTCFIFIYFPNSSDNECPKKSQ